VTLDSEREFELVVAAANAWQACAHPAAHRRTRSTHEESILSGMTIRDAAQLYKPDRTRRALEIGAAIAHPAVE